MRTTDQEDVVDARRSTAAAIVGSLVTLAMIARTCVNNAAHDTPIGRLRSASSAANEKRVGRVGHRRNVSSTANEKRARRVGRRRSVSSAANEKRVGRVGHRRSVSSVASATPIGAQLPPHKKMQQQRRSCTPRWT